MINTAPVLFEFPINYLKVTLLKTGKKIKKLVKQISNVFEISNENLYQILVELVIIYS